LISSSSFSSSTTYPLTGLTSIKTLILHGCSQLIGDLSVLAKLSSLRELSLGACRQFNLTPLGRLTSLQWLDLNEHDQLSNLSPLPKGSEAPIPFHFCFGLRRHFAVDLRSRIILSSSFV
jgi:Leucine-rich repeat (LRR) protein